MQKDTEVRESLAGNQFGFDVWYAEAWSKKQGQFSNKLASNLINYLKTNNRPIKSVLDVCSGSGEFISAMRNICVDCVGVDNADGYLSYSRNHHSDVEFIKIDKLYDFKLKRKFDLVSCNRDVVNMFTQFEQWQTFFTTAYNHLNDRGILMFDFYTQTRLEGWNEVVYDQSEDLDYVSKVCQNNGLCVMSEVYYLKESSVYYRKTSDVMVEAWFETSQILDALKKVGFTKIKLVDISLNELAPEKVDSANRIHILAEK